MHEAAPKTLSSAYALFSHGIQCLDVTSSKQEIVIPCKMQLRYEHHLMKPSDRCGTQWQIWTSMIHGRIPRLLRNVESIRK
ncbi:hypothetical protein QYF36_021000 [Acer negundo]|nr:hypothetical protein QYF36_021000 [Acer negundo]